MTMVELLVVVVLLSIVAVIMYGFLDNTTNTSQRVEDNVTAERDAMIALRRVSQDVRSANPVVTTSAGIPTCPKVGISYGNCLEVVLSRNANLTSAVQCDIGNGRVVALPFRRTTYWLQNEQVWERRAEHSGATAAACTTPASVLDNRPVIAEVTNPGAATLFSFLDRDGAAIASGGALTNVAAVRINLQITFRRGVAPLTLSSVAALRNYR